MPDVKWIKLTTEMFDDEKIKIIESMPDKDAVLIIWIKILVLAGKCNALHGVIFLNETLPYTDEMLSTIFNRPLNTVRLALDVFKRFGMIEIFDDGKIKITNWEKYQNIKGLDRIREQTKIRVRKHRDGQKLLENKPQNVTKIVTLRNATDKNKKENNIYSRVIDFLNSTTGKNYKPSSQKTKSLINARINDGFDEDDFYQVIKTKSAKWGVDPKMAAYLRPETLFGTKFESYLNESERVDNHPKVGDILY